MHQAFMAHIVENMDLLFKVEKTFIQRPKLSKNMQFGADADIIWPKIKMKFWNFSLYISYNNVLLKLYLNA